ncbi:MAG: hypothetical protein ACLQPH_03065 [Acidimicrobiales bacterium]
MFPALVLVFTSLTTGSAGLSNPPQSIPPSPAFDAACFGASSPTPACDAAAVANINAARAKEGVAPIQLPPDFARLSVDKRLVKVTNAERTARGLRSLPETRANNRLAQTGAQNDTDPIGPPGRGWGSIWAGGVADPLAADYLWMYDDGPNSPNSDCPQPGAPGCWGHRDNILGSPWASAGAGHAPESLAELFVQ